MVTAQLAALLVYGQLRTAQRRLARLVEYGLIAGFWAAGGGVQRPRGRYAYALTYLPGITAVATRSSGMTRSATPRRTASAPLAGGTTEKSVNPRSRWCSTNPA